jgi:hypothetical protein
MSLAPQHVMRLQQGAALETIDIPGSLLAHPTKSTE